MKKLFVLITIVLIGAEILQPSDQTGNSLNNGLFSWSSESISKEMREGVFQTMNRYGLTELYQNISRSEDRETIRTFFEDAASQGISVYLLTGDPKWGFDPDGIRMVDEVRRASELKKDLDPRGVLKGVMMDTEPYVMSEWKKQKEEIMGYYVSGMEAAYMEAEKHRLELIACIPYSYDTQGLEEGLERLISSASHRIAIMNYYKGREGDNIAKELELTEKYGKKLTTVYELTRSGLHDLREVNTYHNDGMGELLRNWEELQLRFKGMDLSYAIHHYTALLEVIDNE